MNQVVFEPTFEAWRDKARELLQQGQSPKTLLWHPSDLSQVDLFSSDEVFVPLSTRKRPSVPKKFFEIAKTVSYHRDPARWALLYRIAWRLCFEEPKLMEILVDDDIHRLMALDKAVHRDAHKMKAFVRFRKITEALETYIAWYRPDNFIVPYVAPFFARRFEAMRWSILTPDESVHWDGETLSFTEGVPRSEAPLDDELENLWRKYYVSIFNPSRIKIRAMKREMPVRFWETLPESQEIRALLREGERRTTAMLAEEKISAANFLPSETSYPELKTAVQKCQGCPIYKNSTQAVFGEGALDARLVIVGEQPGNEEDLEGVPFVGPAGIVLDAALEAAGIDRRKVYFTNAVKHFKFQRVGKRRMHQKPREGEVIACKPWLDEEMKTIRPEVVVCLGATAGLSVIGKLVRVGTERGVFLRSAYAEKTILTYHPSAILRAADEPAKQLLFAQLVDDLKKAVTVLTSR